MTRRDFTQLCPVFRGLFVLFGSLLLVQACADSTPEPPPEAPWEEIVLARPVSVWPVGRSDALTGVFGRRDASGWTSLDTQLEWESSAPQVLSVEGAQARALSPGQARLTARLGALSASGWVRVVDLPEASVSLAVWPVQVMLIPGSRRALWSVASAAGEHVDAREMVQWETSDAQVATVDPQTSHVLAHAPGRATLQAQVAGARAQVEVVVREGEVQQLDIEPVIDTLPPKSALALRASALLGGTAYDVTHTTRWGADAPQVASVQGAMLHTSGPGEVALSATYGGSSQRSKIAVAQGAVEAVELIPEAVSWGPEQAIALRAVATLNGGQLDLTQSATWQADDPLSSGRFEWAGMIYGPQAATARVVASFGGKSAQVVALVEPPEPLEAQALELDPAALTLPAGTSFPVELRRVDPAKRLSAQAVWWSEDPKIAFVGMDPSNKGRVRAVSPGRTVVWAKWGQATVSMQVEVTDAALTRIELTPQAARVPIGYRGQYSATGVFDDGSSLYITQEVTWLSDAPRILHVHNTPSRQGQSVARSVGDATVRALWRGVEGATSVEVVAK